MIILTRIDGRQITINADEIETVESSHDTTVSLKSGKKFIVTETAEQIIGKVIAYKQECFSKILQCPEILSSEE